MDFDQYYYEASVFTVMCSTFYFLLVRHVSAEFQDLWVALL